MVLVSDGYPVPNHPNVGRQVRITSRGNESKRAWLDAEKGETSKMVYVLIEDYPGRPLRATRVMKTSVANMHSEATTRFQAMLQQIPDIETMINKLAKKIAKCKVEGDSELKDHLGAKVDEALARLRSTGNTDWTEVQFGSDSPAEQEGRTRAAERAAEEAQRAATAATEMAEREARRRAEVEGMIQQMNERFATLEAELLRQRQRSSTAEARATLAENELETMHRNQVEDHLDDLDLMSTLEPEPRQGAGQNQPHQQAAHEDARAHDGQGDYHGLDMFVGSDHTPLGSEQSHIDSIGTSSLN